MMFDKAVRGLAGLGAGLVLATAAPASVQISGIALDPVAARLGRTVYVPAGYAEVSPGVPASATVSWQAYTATLADMLSAPASFYAPTTLALDVARRGQLSTLVTNAAALPITADGAAATQLAIWEILFERPAGGAAYDVSLGNFAVAGGASAAAVATANLYLANLTSGLWRADASTDLDLVLAPASRLSTQSLFAGATVTTPSLATAIASVTPAVPEPASWAMMTIGFGALGLALRRRKPAGDTRAIG